MSITKRVFGRNAQGETVTQYILTNAMGAAIKVIDFGAILTSVTVPDRNGKLADVVTGFDDMEGYLKPHGSMGETIGRYGNRIAKGRFTIDGETYQLAINNGENHLHGGKVGFGAKMWQATELPGEGKDSVKLHLVSPDGEENYPGTLVVDVTYTWTDRCDLMIRYEAATDKATHCNLTNHSYFNLNGGGSALGHTLQIFADAVTERTPGLIPTGVLAPVAGTKFDFSAPKPLCRDLPGTDAGSLHTDGYDDNFCLSGTGLRESTVLTGDRSGIIMTVLTTTPGMQLYTANFLSPRTGKGGAQYQEGGAVCLETQFYPDAIHHANFPSPVLRAGSVYRETTILRFA